MRNLGKREYKKTWKPGLRKNKRLSFIFANLSKLDLNITLMTQRDSKESVDGKLTLQNCEDN